MKDLHSNIGLRTSIAPAVQAATVTGAVIDRKGFESVTYVVNAGAIVGAGDFGAKIQHSDTTTSGDFVDVPAQYVIGALPATLTADSVGKLGYVGHKQYTRLVATKAGGTSIALGAVAVLGHANERPVA